MGPKPITLWDTSIIKLDQNCGSCSLVHRRLCRRRHSCCRRRRRRHSCCRRCRRCRQIKAKVASSDNGFTFLRSDINEIKFWDDWIVKQKQKMGLCVFCAGFGFLR